MESKTLLILKVWEPYIIRYPRPSLAARNSPITTPTKQSPMFTFMMLKMLGILAGRTTSFRQW